MLQMLTHPQPPRYLSEAQLNPAPRLLLVVLLLLCMLAVSVYFIKRFPVSDAVLPFAQQQVTLPSGQQVQLLLFANTRVNNHVLQSRADVVAAALVQCQRTSWQQVYLSISHEKQILNITLKGENHGRLLLRNLKVADADRQLGFVNPPWLHEVALCE